MWPWLMSMLGQSGSTTAAGTATDASSSSLIGQGALGLGTDSSTVPLGTGAMETLPNGATSTIGAQAGAAMNGSATGATWSIPTASQASLPAQSGTMHTPQSAQLFQMGAQHSGGTPIQVSTPSAVSTYFNPLTSAYNKTVSDWNNPNVGLIGRGMDVANTAGQFKNVVHGNGGQMQQGQTQLQTPQIPSKADIVNLYMNKQSTQN